MRLLSVILPIKALAFTGPINIADSSIQKGYFYDGVKSLKFTDKGVISSSLVKYSSQFFTHKSEGVLNEYWVREIDTLNDACRISVGGFDSCAGEIADSLAEVNKILVSRGRAILQASEIFLFGLKIVRDWEDEILIRSGSTTVDNHVLSVVKGVFAKARQASRTGNGNDMLEWTVAYGDSRSYKVDKLKYLSSSKKDKPIAGRVLVGFTEAVLVMSVIRELFYPNEPDRWTTFKNNSVASSGAMLWGRSFVLNDRPAITLDRAAEFSKELRRLPMSTIQQNYVKIMEWLENGANSLSLSKALAVK